MKFEYLLLISSSLPDRLHTALRKHQLSPILARSLWREYLFLLVYVAWDSAVTNRHWYFNAPYILDFRLFKLPIEEWLFSSPSRMLVSLYERS